MNDLNPSILDVHYLPLKKRAQVLRAAIDQNLKGKTGLKILDIGCGSKPYKELFTPFSNSYIGIDTNKESEADIIASAEKLPFEDSSFDVVFSTQTLEHVFDYQKAVDEMVRVLRPGGFLFLTTHGVYPIHGAPFDYYRWTNYGLEYVFRKFSERRVIPIGGAILCLFQLVNLYIYHSRFKKIPIIGLLVNAAVLFNNVVAWWGDKLFYRDNFLVENYLVIAQK